MTRSRKPALVGEQRPRVSSFPRAKSSAITETVELAEEAGLVLDQWQRFVLEHSLGERPDGLWAAFEVGLIVARQNGKGGVLEARELAGLALFGEELITHSAHEFKTATEAFLRMQRLLESSDSLSNKIFKIRTSHGEEGFEFRMRRGAPIQRLRYVARSQHSGRGFTGDLVVLDEAYALKTTEMGAILPTLSAVPNPQVWYTSTIGDEAAVVLDGVRRRGHDGSSKRLAFFEWSCEEKAKLDDRKAWRQANPAMGIRITEDYIEAEREALSDADFARERLGIRRLGASKRDIPAKRWTDAEDAKAAPVPPLSFGVDVLPDRSAGAIVVCGDGAVELVEHDVGVEWIAPRARALQKRWSGSISIDGRGPAATVADEIEKKGGMVERMSSAEVASACEAFYDAVVNRTIAIFPNDVMRAAAAGAVKKKVGDRFVWDRSRSSTDVTPIMAASLAVAAAKQDEDFAMVI